MKVKFRLNAGEPSGKEITSVVCLGVSPVEDNRRMYFNMGAEGNEYHTEDEKEINELRHYIKTHQNPWFYEVFEGV